MIVNTGNIAPKKPGVYIVTTDTGSSWSYFTGWFNGQYWYEFSRADAIGSNAVPRKKCARLAVTAWAEIDSYAFSDAIKENQKARSTLDIELDEEHNMLHMNKPYSTAWRVWNQLKRIANAETERMVNYANGMLAGAAAERMMEEGEFARLTALANELADARRNQLRAGA